MVMKKISMMAMTALGVVCLVGCGSPKTAVQAQQDVEVVVPCSGPEFMTDNEYFRASAMGLSTDMNIAKKKAMTEARTGLAEAINVKVQAVTDNYSSSYQQGENEEAKGRYQSLARQVVSQELSGVRVICEKTMKTPDGKYKVYVSVELAGNEIMEAMANRIKNDDKLRIDFEYEKFKNVFEEEMSKVQQ